MRALDLARLVRDDVTLGTADSGKTEAGASELGIQEELARTIADVLVRRTQIFYRDANQGLDF